MKINCLVALILFAAPVIGAEKPYVFPDEHRSFLDRYCLDCHNNDTSKGKFNLENLSYELNDELIAGHWQKVLEVLNANEMPPENKKQPSDLKKAGFLEDLSLVLVSARKYLQDRGGKTVMRRLNQREYKNTMMDLFGVEVELSDLPKDNFTDGFDTDGATLYVNTDDLGLYMASAKNVVDLYFSQLGASKEQLITYRTDPEHSANKILSRAIAKEELKLQETRKKFTDLSRGIIEELKKPQNVSLYKKYDSTNANFGRLIDLAKSKPDFLDINSYGYESLNDALLDFKGYTKRVNELKYNKRFSSLALSQTGSYLQLVTGTTLIDFTPAEGLKPGNYRIKIKALANKHTEPNRHFLEVGIPEDSKNLRARGTFTSNPLHTVHVPPNTANNDGSVLEFMLQVNDYQKATFAIRERQPPFEFTNKEISGRGDDRLGKDPAIWVDWIELHGPLTYRDLTDFDRMVLTAKDSNNYSRYELTPFLKKFSQYAFRGKLPDDAFITAIADRYDDLVTSGLDHGEALKNSLSIILSSPSFLYLAEEIPSNKPSNLGPLDLANRLAYFLWSSPPDNELYNAATSGVLLQGKHYQEQVSRMINSPQVYDFISGFMHQWLDMQRLDLFQFDSPMHVNFNVTLKDAARHEVYQTFKYLLQGGDGGHLVKLIKSDFIFTNALLADHYGIKGVNGDQFRRINVSKPSPRGGLLGMAAINAMGSDGLESNPVERGAWVLRHIMNEPPPPAPANVTQISELDGGKNVTIRGLLAKHQESPQCASCHHKIDPIGFGLENFNATGQWRENYGKKNLTIVPADTLHSGYKFKDFFELRDIMARKYVDSFARGFVEALIAYGLGRPFGFTDEDLANEIMEYASRGDYRIKDFIIALTTSRQFRSKIQ